MKRRPPALVVVTGPPAAGKTSVAHELGRRLRFAMVSKDDVKEALFDKLGVEDREASHRLGRAAVESIFRIAERILGAGNSLVLEANFDRATESERVAQLAAAHRARMVQVFVTCDPMEAFERYEARTMRLQRHHGHYDAANIEEWRNTGVPLVEALDLPCQTLLVDTTEGADVDAKGVYAAVKAALG